MRGGGNERRVSRLLEMDCDCELGREQGCCHPQGCGSQLLKLNMKEDINSLINGSSESVLNPTDVLTKANGPESNKEGNKSFASKMPKFIVKPKPAAATANPQKKQKTESTAVQDNGKAPAAEEKIEASEGKKTNVLQSLCQYDSDESD
ncbi:unnamed protein product [Triticum turgidum subsp. durum]|uniref:Uncharacterized protein n=1 Tax=Triticum turgidum subsp. durum TaxID=4567 RepID=A0A9R1PSM5_TRITD|nr:unnamed protein product [Triticum turgidum subsp. durum]